MSKLKSLGVLFGVLFLGTWPAMADRITYNVSQQLVGGGSATGFIVTLGNIGTQTTGDIWDWDITLNDGSSTFELFGPHEATPNSSATVVGDALTATDTALSFDFGASSGEFLIDPISEYFCLAAKDGCVDAGNAVQGISWKVAAVKSETYLSKEIFATVPSATPLPAALPLFATGLGALGLLGWRRKRKARALTA